MNDFDRSPSLAFFVATLADLVMSRALGSHLGDISVDLRVTLSSFQVHAALLSQLLVS